MNTLKVKVDSLQEVHEYIKNMTEKGYRKYTENGIDYLLYNTDTNSKIILDVNRLD